MTIDISILVSVVAGIVAIASFFRNGRKESTESATSLARIEVKLDSISKRVDDVCQELVQHREEIGKHRERLVDVESSTKSAHKRLDGLEERIANLEAK